MKAAVARGSQYSTDVSPESRKFGGMPGLARHAHRLSSLRGLVLPLLILLVWQLVSTHLDSTFLPTPGLVWTSWVTWAFGKPSSMTWTSGTFFEYSWDSASRVFLGFAIGASLGVAIGIIVGWYRIAAVYLDPMLQAIRPVPAAAWLPFATLLLGIGDPAAVFVIALATFFPVFVNTAAGARQTPQLLVRAALMLGTRPHRLLYRVVIPSAMPSIVSGLRLGMGIAWVMVIVAEMLAVRGGLGYAIWGAYNFLRMDLIIAAIIAIGFYGWLSDHILVMVARRLMRWQRGLVKQ